MISLNVACLSKSVLLTSYRLVGESLLAFLEGCREESESLIVEMLLGSSNASVI